MRSYSSYHSHTSSFIIIIYYNQVVFFARSASIRSSKYLNLLWLGDQLTSYDAYDGLASIIPGALSAGLSGHSFVHSDIGGYNSFTNISDGFYYARDQELLQRWSELSAFGTSLFRTHIGASRVGNAQVYDSDESLSHFQKFARIYGQLSDYRFLLMDNAIETGIPMMLPMVSQFFYDPEILKLPDPPSQYLFGNDFIVSPSMTKGEAINQIYIPSLSSFVHLWSGNEIQTGKTGVYVEVPAYLGYPNVWYRKKSQFGDSLR